MDVRFRLTHLDGLAVGVWLHSSKDPPAEEWFPSCQKLADWVLASNGDVSSYRVFMVSDGGAPGAAQRKELFQGVLRGYPVPTAVVTTALGTNPVKRGVATTLHLLNPKFRVFEPREVLGAIAHLGIERARFAPVWKALLFLQQGMTRIKTLHEVATELGITVEPIRPSQIPPSWPPPK